MKTQGVTKDIAKEERSKIKLHRKKKKKKKHERRHKKLEPQKTVDENSLEKIEETTEFALIGKQASEVQVVKEV